MEGIAFDASVDSMPDDYRCLLERHRKKINDLVGTVNYLTRKDGLPEDIYIASPQYGVGREITAADVMLGGVAVIRHWPIDWQPIETAPQDTDVLTYSPHGFFVARFNSDCGIWERPDNQFKLRDLTHWVPLPVSPTL
jgi:hypothetical protein